MAESTGAVMQDVVRSSRSTVSDSPDFSRLVDLKGLAKLPEFDGTDSTWPDWKFRFEAVIGLMGMESALKEARTVVPDEDLLPDREKHMSSTLWSIMAQILHGRAYSLLKTVKRETAFWIYCMESTLERVRITRPGTQANGDVVVTVETEVEK